VGQKLLGGTPGRFPKNKNRLGGRKNKQVTSERHQTPRGNCKKNGINKKWQKKIPRECINCELCSIGGGHWGGGRETEPGALILKRLLVDRNRL